MMDGRIGAIRKALEAEGAGPHPHHGLQRQIRQRLLRPVPRRSGIGGQPGQTRQNVYQMDPGSSDEALREVAIWTSPKVPTW